MHRFTFTATALLLSAFLLVSSPIHNEPWLPPLKGVASVWELKPFSPEANYMSLEGFYRWRYYLQDGRWISFPYEGPVKVGEGSDVRGLNPKSRRATK